MIGILIGNTIGKGGGSSAWTPNLPLGGETPSFWIKENARNVLTLTDSLGHNATILPSCGKCDADNYMLRAVADFASTVTSGYVEWRGYYDGGAGTLRLFGSGDQSAATRFFTVYIVTGKPVIYVRQLSPAITNQCITDNAISIGWHTLRFESVGGNYRITDNGSVLTVGSGLTMLQGTDNGKWISDVTGRDNISSGCLQIKVLKEGRSVPRPTWFIYVPRSSVPMPRLLILSH